MKMPIEGIHDLTAVLIKEWLPLDVEPSDASPDAQLIALALLAIAEQLKDARSDRNS